MTASDSLGMRDATSRNRARIDVHVGDVRQLINSMDPAPFRERELDPRAVAYIVDKALKIPHKGPLRLAVSLSGKTSPPEDVAALPQAVRDYFAQRSVETRTALRRLLRIGGWSLLIGVSFVGATNLIGDWLGEVAGNVLHESFMVGAWVAMWRPLEILLYDWWPVLSEARLYDRLAAMPVEVEVLPKPR